MESVEKINKLIKDLETTEKQNKVSDGYHSFGELYDHRVMLFILVCKFLQQKEYYVWRSKTHHDGSCIEDMFVMGIGKESGSQISYHMEIDQYWGATDFADEPENVPVYDNHTSVDVLKRMQDIISKI